MIEFFEGIFNFFQYLINTVKGGVAVFNSFFSFISSMVSGFIDIVTEFYKLSPFLTVPITAIGIAFVVMLILGIIKALPLM